MNDVTSFLPPIYMFLAVKFPARPWTSLEGLLHTYRQTRP